MRGILLTLSLLMLLITSCTKEDLSGCAFRTTFMCRFVPNNDGADQFSQLVNKVDLYIFDESGLLVKHISQTQDNFPEQYSISVNLKSGTYTAVMYGTRSDNDEVSVGSKQGNLTTALLPMKEGESRMSDMRLMLNSLSGHTDKDLGVILHGIVPQVHVTNTYDEGTHVVSFTRNTHQVELNVSGLEYWIVGDYVQPRAQSEIAVRIEGNNKAYLYDNTLDTELGAVIYEPYKQELLDMVLVSQLSVLKLFKEQPMALKIYHGSTVIWELDLMAEILKSPKYTTNEDLNREGKFVVNVTITSAGDFSIVVNGWTTTTAGEIIG